MITVEELIVQSLYHRLVLVTVRRSTVTQSQEEHEKHENQETVQEQNGSSEANTENGTLDKGLGYLYLGPNAGNDSALSHSSDSAAIVKALHAAGESVQVTRQVQTVLDNGELQLIHSSTGCCSAECQTDFEPMWFFGSVPSHLTVNESDELMTRASNLPLSRGFIDMRNCEKFTVARLEDIRDPSAQSFVMVQASGMSGGGDADCGHELSDQKQTVLPGSSMLSAPLGSAPVMFVGNNMQWKHELELGQPGSVDGSAESSHNPANIDSGIWDMVQAFGSSEGDASHVDLFNSVAGRSCGKEVQNSEAGELSGKNDSELKGTYRMFSTTGSSRSEFVETARCGNISVSNGEVRRREYGGGLGDVLEPVAVVDFVLHRVEADGCYEKLRGPQLVGNSKVSVCHEENTEKEENVIKGADGMNLATANNPAQTVKNELRVSDTDDGTSGKSGQSSDHSSDEDETISSELRSDGDHIVSAKTVSVIETVMTERGLKTSNALDKTHKDMVEITSVRLARRSTKRRSAGRYKYWRESHLRSRKVKSADTSPRCSSLIDVATDPHELTCGVGSLSLAQSSELLDNQSAVGAADSESSSRRMYKRVNDTRHHQHPVVSSPSSSWQHVGQLTRKSSSNLSASSLDWLAYGVVPGFDRTTSVPTLDLFNEPDLMEFEKFPNWMRDLPDVLHSVPISQLCIPGSHIAIAVERDMRTDLDFSKCNYEMADFLRKLPDLALFNNFRALMKNIWRTWMPKQCLSLYDQMVAGSRYIDLRIMKYSNELYGEHGLYTRPLKAYMRDVRRFIEEHTSEIVILHFQSSDFLDRADKRHLVTSLFQSFGAKMACNTSTTPGSTLSLPTLKQMWSGGKQIIIFFPSADMELICNHIFGGLVWSDELVYLAASPKTQTVADLIQSLDTALPSSSDTNMLGTALKNSDHKLNVVKAVLSPDMSMVFGRFEYRSMRELVTYETAGAVSRWLDGKVDGSLNVVAIDFIGIGDVVRKVLSINVDLAKRLSTV